jgi:TorA maturation chaperone TorD
MTTATEQTVERALAGAVFCRTLKLGLDRPSPELLETVGQADGRGALRVAAGFLDGKSGGPVCGAVSRLFALGAPELSVLDQEYGALFGHSLHGKVCPYETEYGAAAMLQQAHQLADLQGFYAAFGLQVARASRERADHIACQMEFLEVLLVKEAWALEQGDAEMAEVTGLAIRRFLIDHLARFGAAFARSLAEAAGQGFYARLGELFETVLETVSGSRGVQVGSPTLELRAWDPDDAPMACGSVGLPAPESDLVALGSRDGLH